MKKYSMLGVSQDNKTCCVLECLLPFSMLNKDEIQASDFHHDSTNWNGCDEINRTMNIRNFKKTGNKIVLNKPITYYGSDSDMGQSYSWSYNVFEIWEIE